MTNSNGGDNMSAQKRQRMLIGFGGLAIVLVAVIAFVSPNFRNEEASGAIGAVQKHRAPQITQSDVVLGDEQTKEEQQVLYADFLSEASALQNISASLASESQSVEARSQMAAKSLDARVASLQARYQQHAKSALEAMRQLGAEDQLGSEAIQELSARISSNLQARDMETISARMAAIVNQLEAAQCCAAAMRAKSLEAIESQLNAFAIEARVSNALAASPQLQTLRQAAEADALGARIRARAEYLEAAAKEAKSLEAARQALEAKSLDAKSLGRISAQVFQQAAQLEARAVDNIEANLAAHSASVEALGRMRMTLDAANKSLDARANSLDARSLEAARSNLDAISRDLQARNVEMQARSAVGLRAQLAAVHNHLDARSQGARASLASAAPDAQNFAAIARDLSSRIAALQARQQ